jgi:tetratricopeptide (TPR) repeat protein
MDDYYDRELIAHLVEVRDEIVRSDYRQGDRSRAGANLMRDGLDAAIAQMDSGFDYIAVTAERGFEAVTTQLAELAASVDKIRQLAQAPRRAGAAERFNDGIYALGRGLVDDAVTELRAAAELNRFDPVTHFFLGDAYYASGDDASAAQAYADAVKYRMDDLKDWTVTAARRAAEAYRAVNPSDARQQAILAAGFDAVPDAAEIALDLARFAGAEGMLVVALRLAPELVLSEAGILGLPNLEQAAGIVLAGAGGLEERYENARTIESRAITFPEDGPLQAEPRLGPLPEQASASRKLTLVAAALRGAPDYLRVLAGLARDTADRRSADIRSRIARHQNPALPRPVAPRRPPDPDPSLKARLFPAPGAREAYQAAMAAYDAELERYELRQRDYARAEAERQHALAAARRDAESEPLIRDQLHALAEIADAAAAWLTPRYTKGVRTPRAARPRLEPGRPDTQPA